MKKVLDRSTVKVQKSRSDDLRKGRGYSMKELTEAKLSPQEANALNLPVDARRKSCHPENVETLAKLKVAPAE